MGWNLCNLLKERFSLLGSYHTHKITIPYVRTVRVDLSKVKQVAELFACFCPHIVLHAAALTHSDYCEDHTDESLKIDVSATEIIADASRQHDAKPVFTSSDMVFDGEHAPFGENAPVNPVNRYGEHKDLAEAYLQHHNPDATICYLPVHQIYLFCTWPAMSVCRGMSWGVRSPTPAD